MTCAWASEASSSRSSSTGPLLEVVREHVRDVVNCRTFVQSFLSPSLFQGRGGTNSKVKINLNPNDKKAAYYTSATVHNLDLITLWSMFLLVRPLDPSIVTC